MRTKDRDRRRKGSFDENAPPTPPIWVRTVDLRVVEGSSFVSRRRGLEAVLGGVHVQPAAAAGGVAREPFRADVLRPVVVVVVDEAVRVDPDAKRRFIRRFVDDASIRESAMKVLDSPEAAAAAALSEELLARLEEESALMESLTESGDDGTGTAASFVDPIDSWLAKAQRAGAKGVAESRELRLALASSRTHRDDYNDKGGTETEEETEEEDGPGPGSPAWTVWANASMEARRDENSPLGFAAGDVNVARFLRRHRGSPISTF